MNFTDTRKLGGILYEAHKGHNLRDSNLIRTPFEFGVDMITNSSRVEMGLHLLGCPVDFSIVLFANTLLSM